MSSTSAISTSSSQPSSSPSPSSSLPSQPQTQKPHTKNQKFAEQNALHYFSDFLSSCLGIMLSMFISHPIDTLRVRRQTALLSPLQTIRRHGLLSVYHGLATPLLTTGPAVANSMALNDAFKRAIIYYRYNDHHHHHHHRDNDSRQQQQQQPTLSFPELAVAGGCAGVVSAVIQCPIAVIRIQQQVRAVKERALGGNGIPTTTATTTTATNTATTTTGMGSGQQQANANGAAGRGVGRGGNATGGVGLGFFGTARDVYRHQGGVRAFYRGLPLEAFQAGTGRLVYFTVYQRMKEFLARQFEITPPPSSSPSPLLPSAASASAQPTDTQLSTPLPPPEYRVPLLGQWFIAGVTASWCGWIVVYPCDVIKSRLQGDYMKRTVDVEKMPTAHAATATVQTIKKQEGDRNKKPTPSPTTTNAQPTTNNTTVYRYRSQYNGILHCARVTYKELGLKGMWLGLPLTLCRSVASSGVCLPAYEVFRPYMHQVFTLSTSS